MSDLAITGTDPNVTKGGVALRGFWAYEEIYVKSVPDVIEALHGLTAPVTLRSSDEALLQFIASRLYCPLLDNRRILVPMDVAGGRLHTVQTLALTANAYLDYDEILAYIEGHRPEWVCFQCATQSRALTFVRYFRQYKSSPMLYVMRDSLCIYVREKSDAYQYDELTPDSMSLIEQMGEDGPSILHEYTQSVLAARRERRTESDPNSFASGQEE